MEKYRSILDNSIAQAAGTSFSAAIKKYDVTGFSYQLSWTDDTSSFSNKTFDTGVAEVATLTFLTKANTDDGDYIVVSTQDGTEYAVAVDLTGSSAEPTGAIWVAIPAAQKTQADINAETSAADVAAVFELAFDGLAGFTAKCVTDDTAANGTMTFTQQTVGVTTDPVPKDDDDAGAGTIATAETTPGVDEEVDIGADTVAIPAHGYITDLKVQLTTTGTLPAGVTTSTDYYLIITDAGNIQFAATAGGAAINLTTTGTGVHTVAVEGTVAGVITLQQSNDGVAYFDTSTTDTISAAGSAFNIETDQYQQFVRLKIVMTEGVSTVTAGYFSIKP